MISLVSASVIHQVAVSQRRQSIRFVIAINTFEREWIGRRTRQRRQAAGSIVGEVDLFGGDLGTDLRDGGHSVHRIVLEVVDVAGGAKGWNLIPV